MTKCTYQTLGDYYKDLGIPLPDVRKGREDEVGVRVVIGEERHWVTKGQASASNLIVEGTE